MSDKFIDIGSKVNKTEDFYSGGFITDDDIQKKADIILSNKRRVIAYGAESIPDNIKDSDWVRQTLRAGSLDFKSSKNDLLRYWSTADTKFEDTTLGGNFVINPRPQFTRYADTRARGIDNTTEVVKVNSTTGRYGMGHYYSEAIDDTHQTIHMIFGQPEFNSLTNYFGNFFDYGASKLANGGRWTTAVATFFKNLTQVFLGVMFMPITVLLYGASKLSDIIDFLTRRPASKYYYMRPNMTLYWSIVSRIVNEIAVTSGMTRFTDKGNSYKEFTGEGANAAGGGNLPSPDVNKDFKNLFGHFGDMFNENGYINIQKVANRAQRMRNGLDKIIEDKIDTGDINSFNNYLHTLMRGRQDTTNGIRGVSLTKAMRDFEMDTYKIYEQRFANQLIGKVGDGDKDKSDKSGYMALEAGVRSVWDGGKGLSKQAYDQVVSAGANTDALAEWRDGSAFATFRVDHTGSVSESFSSSTGETDLASKFNDISAQMRSAKFSLAGGNISDGPVGAAITTAVAAAKGVVEGLMTSVGLGGVLAPGQSFADIPQYWQNSTANMPSMNYSIDLISPYNDPLSRTMNIYIPLAMIIAGGLPLSTGKQSYTSPFLCQVFDQGRAITRLGMIKNINISRGTSNLAYNKDKNFLAVNVTFTVEDLSSIMHIPVANGFSKLANESIWDEDTLYSDYIGVLSSLSLGKSYYLSEKLAINVLKMFRAGQDATNTSSWISWLHEKTSFGITDIFFKGTERY